MVNNPQRRKQAASRRGGTFWSFRDVLLMQHRNSALNTLRHPFFNKTPNPCFRASTVDPLFRPWLIIVCSYSPHGGVN
jgi:hypothetical protein